MADEGTTSAAVPEQPPRLTHEELRGAQADTLKAPRRRYGIAARILFTLLDVVYGKPRTLSKFKEAYSGQHYRSCETHLELQRSDVDQDR
jgi:hypothetical protein